MERLQHFRPGVEVANDVFALAVIQRRSAHPGEDIGIAEPLEVDDVVAGEAEVEKLLKNMIDGQFAGGAEREGVFRPVGRVGLERGAVDSRLVEVSDCLREVAAITGPLVRPSVGGIGAVAEAGGGGAKGGDEAGPFVHNLRYDKMVFEAKALR